MYWMLARKTIELQLLTLTLLLTMAGCSKDKGSPESVSFKPSFSISDKEPLGLYAAHSLFRQAFQGYELHYNNQSFKDYFTKFAQYDYNRTKTVFAIISKQFLPTIDDVESMSEFVKHGNTLFVASNQYDGTFLEKFNLRTERTASLQTMMKYMMEMKETGVSMKDSSAFGSATYRYFFYPLEAAIKRDSSLPSKEIVSTEETLPGAVVFRHGAGRIISIVNATAFTNYFLLTGKNYEYLVHLLSFTPADVSEVTWDTYYNRVDRRKDSSYSDFQELMKYPPLRWATWLFVLGSILLVLLGLVRRQRMIPLIKPNVNSSVEFAKTVSRLYLLKKDNKNIAMKMVTYFLEKIRSRYYVSTSILNHEFAQVLAAKTGKPVETISSLFQTIDEVQSNSPVSDELLLDLNIRLNAIETS